ncbi:MAG: glycosyltransferase [Gammaproteobacteria bacterium]|nr:glycosyltransferase [Gammaproteobacteria bacterium]
MKYLLDSVYTGLPSTCSTSYLMMKIVDYITDAEPDSYFYVLFPERYEDDEVETSWVLNNRPNVQLVIIPTEIRNRMYEHMTFPADIQDLFHPLGRCWDVDAILTSRMMQLTMYRTNLTRDVSYGKGTFQCIIGLDEMPFFKFRDTVAWGSRLGLQTAASYLQADGIVVNNLWSKDEIKKETRDYLSFGKQKQLLDLIQECVPVPLVRLDLMDRRPEPSKDFNIVFCGRITSTRNFAGVVDVFRSNYSFANGTADYKVRYILSTNSRSTGSQDIEDKDFIEVQMNDRVAFHKLLKEEANVVINLSTVEDFSLSTYEPLLFGVPVIVSHHKWSGFLGEDYPFRAESPLEAYAMAKKFTQDYEGMYAKFKKWEETTWASIVNSSVPTTAEAVLSCVQEHIAKSDYYVESRGIGGKYLDIVNGVTEDEVDVYQLSGAVVKPNLKAWRGVPVSKRPSLYSMKMLLRLKGYKDTEKLGIMRRDSDE